MLKLFALVSAFAGIGGAALAAPNVGTLYGRSGDWRIYAYRAGLDDTPFLGGNIGCFMTRSTWGPNDLSVIIPPIGWWAMEIPSSLPDDTALDVPYMLDSVKSSTTQRFVASEGRLSTLLDDVQISALGGGRVSRLTLVIGGNEQQYSLDGFGAATKLTRECHDRKGRK
ncbi:hypothetical protein [Donghicola mangrovi]|uniref:Uncharacterized protein n=1 Tax=Donghicola mangrovi TaxID=2729614 RepID=A0A850Q7C5_9RHOB|nr:hypothetical protein [Donghicola mangrovi]NVO25707.1 hypothetical protein [Donghicola mangrovi]